ncbi:short-chain dehydrogenase/reductase SDR (plasmid) [Scytonema sp. HK-05]|nr:short-chain dehydrogenase/reductase SDR [Scytonema sp. HK-05]
MYFAVVAGDAWPKSACKSKSEAPFFLASVACVCLKKWAENLIPAKSEISSIIRRNPRSLRGLPLSRRLGLGNTGSSFLASPRYSNITAIPLMKVHNYGRIVNVSTEMASLAAMTSDFYPLAPSYRLSKLGVNGLTVLLGKELLGTNILVNAYSPGWMKTDMGGENAPFTAEEGAETAVYLATLPDGEAQGLFVAEMRKFGGPIQLQW